MGALACSLLILFFTINACDAADTIAMAESVRDGESLISAGGEFELGFFRPGNSTNRYVGIWYRDSPPAERTVVWVANRETPVPDSSGRLTVRSGDGNLVLLDGRGKLLWSQNHAIVSANAFAVLTDSGNLELRAGSVGAPGGVLWQSFDFPADTFMPGMRLGVLLTTGGNRVLRSWTNPTDPAPGNFTFGVDIQQPNQFFIWRRSFWYWRSGPWNGRAFPQLPGLRTSPYFNFSVVTLGSGLFFVYSTANGSRARVVMEPSGQVNSYIWNSTTQRWTLMLSQPKDFCSVYAACGAFGSCNRTAAADGACNCLPGFSPASEIDWNLGIYSGGCKRIDPLECGNEEDFVSAANIKVPEPDSSRILPSEGDCRGECLSNCRCTGYTYSSNMSSECRIFSRDLLDLQADDEQGRALHLRISASGSSGGVSKPKNAKGTGRIVLAVVLPVMAAILAAFGTYLWRRKAERDKARGEVFQTPISAFNISAPISKDFHEANRGTETEQRDLNVPFIDLGTIVAATNYFSNWNKLGKGGFGIVYKGTFPGGLDVAVKRLSRGSGQGLEEFKNEVVLMGKLQHRNLVKILGYCIEQDEKILLYEYMSNKSLDRFLFDRNRSKVLDWERRLTIVFGIARGLLYLHQDSRLRIIHRDLKASNILLDEELNPKISDFGMARIFGGNQTQANTNRVVGTFGYMSPEYALEGLFSVKSDVFSFGVLILEIVSGKRNTGFYHSGDNSSLLEHAWHLWQEGKGQDLVDRAVAQECNMSDVLKCIHIALLCVQEDAADRPTMASVVLMLASEASALPTPKQAAFFIGRDADGTESSSNKRLKDYGNEASTSHVHGR